MFKSDVVSENMKLTEVSGKIKLYQNEHGHYYLRHDARYGGGNWYNIIPMDSYEEEEILEDIVNGRY